MKKTIFQLSILCCMCFLAIAVISLCAEIRHGRYNSGIASLPCRDDHDRAYFAATRWLTYCETNGCVTWLTGESHDASFAQPPEMFKWSYTLYFAYAPQAKSDDSPQKLPKWTRQVSIKLIRHERPPVPRMLEYCTLGYLKNIQRLRDVPPLSSSSLKKTCDRRDILDCFRYPFRASDPYYNLL